MDEWQIRLADLYDYFEDNDKRTSLIQDIDRTILRGEVAPLDFVVPFIERLVELVHANGVLLFQPAGASHATGPAPFVLRRAIPAHDRKLPGRLAAEHAPERADLLQRSKWPYSDVWLSPEANALLREDVTLAGETWALLLFSWKNQVVAAQTFVSDVVSQLSIGVDKLISQQRLQYFRALHSLFVEKDLDQKKCLEVVRDKTLAILAKHEEPILLQILFAEVPLVTPAGTDKRSNDPLTIRWSSNEGEVGVRVPLDSVSGRAMRSRQRYLLGDPTAPEFAASYKSFTTESRTELAVVLRKEARGEAMGVLNLESPLPDAFSSDEIESICDLVDLVSPMLAAVRRRVAMARTEKTLAAVGANQSLDRLSRLYAHKFRTLQHGLDSSLGRAREYLVGGRLGDATTQLGAMEEDLNDFKTSHNNLWKSIKSVSRIGPVRLAEVVAELAKEERVTSQRYLDFDLKFLEQMPPVRASGHLKEHLRNLINNAVRAIEMRASFEPPEYKPQIWITAERYAPTQSYAPTQTRDRPEGEDVIAELNQRVRINVRDNGIGLSTDLEETIFEVSYTTWGSGFGLAAARQYARELGGNVKATGGGDGCVITVELPVFMPGDEDESNVEVDHY